MKHSIAVTAYSTSDNHKHIDHLLPDALSMDEAKQRAVAYVRTAPRYNATADVVWSQYPDGRVRGKVTGDDLMWYEVNIKPSEKVRATPTRDIVEEIVRKHWEADDLYGSGFDEAKQIERYQDTLAEAGVPMGVVYEQGMGEVNFVAVGMADDHGILPYPLDDNYDEHEQPFEGFVEAMVDWIAGAHELFAAKDSEVERLTTHLATVHGNVLDAIDREETDETAMLALEEAIQILADKGLVDTRRISQYGYTAGK